MAESIPLENFGNDRVLGMRVIIDNDRFLSEEIQESVVFVIVPNWPGGTMAFKFGAALQTALKVTRDEMRLVQMEPERIFRAKTSVTEKAFRESLAASGASWSGKIRFVKV